MVEQDLARVIEALIVIGGMGGLVYAVFKNSTVKATIQSQKELIETLTKQVSELRTLHIENEKAIAKLSGQLEVYKEIPLKDIADTLKLLHEDHKKILKGAK